MTDEEPNAADPWLTLAEIADELRVNPATVRLWVSKKQLKASRAGVRKWIVRRSDLDRMLSETNASADDVLDRVLRGEPAELGAPAPRRPEPEAEDPEPAPARKPRSPAAEGSVELLRQASAAFERAVSDSALAIPSPGYLDRIRALADACEHVAATMLNAHEKTGIRWRPREDLDEGLPYELKPRGNRPGPKQMWNDFDAAWDRLCITATGHDVVALAHRFREVWDALRKVADELEGDEEWQARERQAQ